MDTARVRAELTVQDLWLRYLAIGGTGDAFDIDGYLQGVVTMDTFQEDVLAHAVNEALHDLYDTYSIPFSTPPTVNGRDDDRLRRLIDEVLDDGTRAPGPDRPSGGHPTS